MKKIVKKYIKIVIILLIILILSFLLYKNHKESVYYNNYYENNKESLNIIKDYVVNSNYQGQIYSDIIKYKPITSDSDINCYINKECGLDSSIIKLIKDINIDYLSYSSGVIAINAVNEIYGNSDNQLYYSKGYYKGKKELDSQDGNSMHVIVKIFNDDWGVISDCYECGFGAWD